MLCRGTIREVANIMAENKQHVLAKQQQRIAPSPQIEPRLRSLGHGSGPWAPLGPLGLQERLLGVAEGSLEAYYVALDEHLAAKGLSWTGKGTSAVTKAAAHLATRRPAAARHPNSPNTVS